MAEASNTGHVSRRGLMGAVGIGAAAVVGAAAAQAAGATAPADPVAAAKVGSYPFYGDHQAGIVTPAQDRLHFAAFDLMPSASRDDLIRLLSDWTEAAARMTTGHGAGPIG